MAKLTFDLSFPKYEEKMYQFLKNKKNGSAFIRELIREYMYKNDISLNDIGVEEVEKTSSSSKKNTKKEEAPKKEEASETTKKEEAVEETSTTEEEVLVETSVEQENNGEEEVSATTDEGGSENIDNSNSEEKGKSKKIRKQRTKGNISIDRDLNGAAKNLKKQLPPGLG